MEIKIHKPMAKLNVLVACEFSGVVRDAFRVKEHNAWSCDLLPCDPSPWESYHLQTDVLSVLNGATYLDGPKSWDLIIAHPPCTHLCVSGARWFATKQVEQRQAIWFFMELANCSAPKLCIENPVGIMSRLWRKPDQIIQPYEYGHPESKKTCLWLKGLPILRPTNILPKPECGYWSNQTPSGQNKLGPSPDRAKNRARTYKGIAEAMADQWGTL
jgi:hypothetical protein